MANLDCQAAFSQEMAKFDEILQASKDILEQLKKPASPSPTPSPSPAPNLSTLEGKIDETNRLLKLLCVGILGKAE